MSLLPDGHRSGLFVKATVDRVAETLVRWGNEEIVGRYTQSKQVTATLSSAWRFVDVARVFTPTRAFLIGIASGWTGFFNNHSHEFLAQAEIAILSERLRSDACFFRYEDDPTTEHCGSAQFRYYKPIPGGTVLSRRAVGLAKEGGWSFTQTGEPLPFEDLTAYQRQKKRDRLTPELLRRYGEAIGLPFWESAAYDHDVALLRWGDGPELDDESALKKVISIFGMPKAILGGSPKPPKP